MTGKVNIKSFHLIQNPCTLSGLSMYRHNQRQIQFEDFDLPFGGKLRSDNRWVRMAKFIPWEEFERDYCKSFKDSGLGPPAKSVRVALGALIIKERLGTSDEETVEQIRENPYLQYLLGYKHYKDERPFDPSLFVYFRKRFGKKKMAKINEAIACKAMEEEKKATRPPDDSDENPSAGPSSNRGKLLVDATCTPADITFPTDLKMLNTAREKSEQIIDILHGPGTIQKELPAMVRQFARFGIDMINDPILVYPTLHYQNGGVSLRPDGATSVPNLFVAGEISGGVHGRNRLMGHSLLEITVYGRRAGRAAGQRAASAGPCRCPRWSSRATTISPALSRSASTFITCIVKSGTYCSRASKLLWSMTAMRVSVSAVTVALRKSGLISAISPTISPRLALAMSLPLMVISTSPSITTNILLPSSPSRMITLPAGKSAMSSESLNTSNKSMWVSDASLSRSADS